MCICAFMYACVYVRVNVYMCGRLCEYVLACTHVYVYRFVCAHACLGMRVSVYLY